jgi:hypothetical protein
LFEYESQNPENVAGIVETKTFRYTDAATKYIGQQYRKLEVPLP